jgi:TonB family protein
LARPETPSGRLPVHKITEQPKKLPLSVFETPYPGPDFGAHKAGAVTLKLHVLGTGAVESVQVAGPRVGVQLEAAAVGAASLLLYSPLKLDGCPVPLEMLYTVNFKLQR